MPNQRTTPPRSTLPAYWPALSSGLPCAMSRGSMPACRDKCFLEKTFESPCLEQSSCFLVKQKFNLLLRQFRYPANTGAGNFIKQLFLPGWPPGTNALRPFHLPRSARQALPNSPAGASMAACPIPKWISALRQCFENGRQSISSALAPRSVRVPI
jgi:hypothetical protein